MNEELNKIVEDVRKDQVALSDSEVESVYDLCLKKMELTNIQNKEEYLPLLFSNELHHYLFRRTVNARTMLMQM